MLRAAMTTSDRSQLGIADLKGRPRTRAKLMSVKIPSTIGDAIDRIADDLEVPKTQVVIALLNTGLDVAAARLKLSTRRRGR